MARPARSLGSPGRAVAAPLGGWLPCAPALRGPLLCPHGGVALVPHDSARKNRRGPRDGSTYGVFRFLKYCVNTQCPYYRG